MPQQSFSSVELEELHELEELSELLSGLLELASAFFTPPVFGSGLPPSVSIGVLPPSVSVGFRFGSQSDTNGTGRVRDASIDSAIPSRSGSVRSQSDEPEPAEGSAELRRGE